MGRSGGVREDGIGAAESTRISFLPGLPLDASLATRSEAGVIYALFVVEIGLGSGEGTGDVRGFGLEPKSEPLASSA